MILTHIVSAVFAPARSSIEEPEIEDLEDERDELLDLKGTGERAVLRGAASDGDPQTARASGPASHRHGVQHALT